LKNKKILMVTTLSNTINAFLLPHIESLVSEGNQVDVCCNLVEPIANEDKIISKIFSVPFSRSPLSTDNIKAYNAVKKIIKSEGYDVIHTHTPNASFITRLASKKSKSQIYYTTHGLHFYEGAPFKNWLLYYPIEKLAAKYTDVIITINQGDYELVKNRFKNVNVELIPGIGINPLHLNSKKKSSSLKNELGIEREKIVILSVGELNDNKNHQVVIKALGRLKNRDFVYLIAGKGNTEKKLRELSRSLQLDSSVKLLGYRKDIPDLINISDVFVFPSKREGLGMAALEAMEFGLPVVASNIGGIKDYIEDNQNGYLFEPLDDKKLATLLETLLNNKNIREDFGRKNMEVSKKYSVENSIRAMSTIYSKYSV
jgi:glycosyltransferase involved in cell wall biosynthesis